MANTGHRGWYSANTMLKLYVLGIKGDEKKNKEFNWWVTKKTWNMKCVCNVQNIEKWNKTS